MKMIVLLILLYPMASFCQTINLPVDSSTNLVTYVRVVNVEAATRDELYRRAKDWIAKSFKSTKNVIQLDDRVDGKIALRGGFDDYTDFYLTLNLKDNKYKYELTNIECSIFVGDNRRKIEDVYKDFLGGKRKKIYGVSLESINKKAQALVISLQTNMKDSKKTDDF